MAGMPFEVDWAELGIPYEAREAWMRSCGAFVYLNAKALWREDGKDWREMLADRYEALYTIFNYGISSPIEAVMAGYLVWLDAGELRLIESCHEPWFDEDYQWDDGEFAFSVQPQVSVGRYRADFMVLIRGPRGIRKIAIECDGHEFHEKTKAQAAHDKKRDRQFVLSGIQVLRFTGSEIWNDGMACFADIQQAVWKAVIEVGHA